MLRKQKLLAFTITIVFTLFFIFTQSVQARDVFVFNKNLQMGNANTDVKELQKFLNNNGFVLNKSGFGSLGKETTFFGRATRNALIKFQKANQIIPAVGYFGPITRSVVNKMMTLLPINSNILENKVNDNLQVDQINNQPNPNIKPDYYTIGGSVTGIIASIVLQNNGRDDLTIDVGQNSDFTFPTAQENGARYNITAKSNYTGQICYINNNIGVVSGTNIKNIKIACGLNLFYNPFTFIPSGASAASYSLTYTSGTGGTISGSTSQTINSGSNGSAVTAVPDTGYSFVSWSDGVLTAERTDTSVTSNKSVSATFAINTYTVTFDTNGGDGGSTATQTLNYNTPTNLTANGFTKTGYTFAGWATTTDGVVGYLDGVSYTIGAGNVTLYAKWTINTYTVTFDTNGGDGGSTATQTLNYNTPTNLTANGFTKTGYTFAGWATTTDGAVGYLDGVSYTIGAGNVTLYAKWTINTYTVTFDTNGGDGGSTATQTLNYDTPTNLTANGFTRTGYTFAGWATSAEGEVAYADSASYTIGAGNVTLYAKWTEIPFACGDDTVTFTYNSSSVTYGTVVGQNDTCWLDRNLGATQVATSSTSSVAYGDLFQWGRPADGHQIRTSGTQSGQVANVAPGTNTFIFPNNDWSSIDSDLAIRSANWGVNGTSNPCPSGFRVPTRTELYNEYLSWSPRSAAGGIASPLKFTMGGFRYYSTASINSVGSIGRYWSITIDAVNSYNLNGLSFNSSGGTNNDYGPANGLSIRCIKN